MSKSPRRITEPEARAAYLAMGPTRTVPALRSRYLADTGVICPAEITIRKWSAKYRWRKLAAEHDAKVAAKASEAVAAKQANRIADLGITPEMVLIELGQIAKANMFDFMAIDGEGDAHPDFSKLTREQAALISEITVDEYMDGKGKGARPVKKTKFKLHSKLDALAKLAQHFGLLKPLVVEREVVDGASRPRDDYAAVLSDLRKLVSDAKPSNGAGTMH